MRFSTHKERQVENSNHNFKDNQWRESENMSITKFLEMNILLIIVVIQISLLVPIGLEGSLMIEDSILLSTRSVFGDSLFG